MSEEAKDLTANGSTEKPLTEEKQTEKQPTGKKLAAKETIEKTASENDKKDTTPKQSRRSLWWIILLLIAAVAGLQATGQLQPLFASLPIPALQTLLMPNDTEQQELKSPKQPQSQAPSHRPTQPTHAIQEKTTPEKAVLTTTTQQPQAQQITPPPHQTDITPPTVRLAIMPTLLAKMDQLRANMQQLEEVQRGLHDALLEQQQVNEHVRLRWIADPDSRLRQMQLAWEEIALLPGLNDQQRQQAVNMQALARANAQRLQQWKSALHQWIDALEMPLHHNILPKPEQAWLAWIVGQFQLRQAPSEEARRLSDLRNRLVDVARQLSIEAWPDQAHWQRLHAELLLQIQAMQQPSNDKTIDTGLPANFAGIQIDITTLRQAAVDWLKSAPQRGVL